jgi:hypothetical protein
MENVESVITADTQSSFVPELLTVACFVLGFWLFSQWRRTGGAVNRIPANFNDLVRTSLAEGHLERAFVYLEEQESLGEPCSL